MIKILFFIPRHLNLKEYPELNCFPLNTLLASYAEKGEKTLIGSVLYEPDFSTFENKDGKRKMIYKSIYNSEFYLKYVYEESSGNYLCNKYCGDKNLGVAWGSGKSWYMFFTNVSSIGLAKGEKCKMEYLKDVID